MGLNGKVCLVTGSGRGIGEAIATKLAEQGANLVVTARTQVEIDSVAKRLKNKFGIKALTVKADVSNVLHVSRLIDTTLTEFGCIDILVNNAGTAVRSELHKMSIEGWNEVIATNLTGVFLVSKAVLPTMIKQRNGYIVNISSEMGEKAEAEWSAYSASKAGVIKLTEVMALENKKYNIKCGVILPGPTDTKLYRKFFPDVNPNDILSPQEIAQDVVNVILKQRSVKVLRFNKRYRRVYSLL